MASWEDFSRILAEAKESKKLDPVGQEDDDVNNDDKVDDTDSYLKKRRASVGAAISADRKKKSMVKISVPEKKLGYKVADIGPDGKEHNVKTHGNYKEALDPVGQEDDDIDNDGKKNTKSDKYLLNRRKVRSKVIEGASTKVDMGGPKVGCDDPDPRSMKTASNLVKTKLRLMGLKPLVMSNEPEGEIVEGKKKDSSYLETDMKKRRENNEKAVEDMKKTKAHADMVKSARKAMGVDEEFVGEDKEYRREMAKASARERAEERREKGGRSAKSPGREGPSAGKTYADYQELSIRAHDKVTKKNKNVVGLVTKEENEIEEGMTMKDFKSNRKKNERKEASADAEKRGHVDRTWGSGRKYTPDEAKSRRSNMSDLDRSQRYRVDNDPDSEHDDYPADKTKNLKKIRKQKVMGEGYLQEKSLSRAQQRFMGMVYAAKKGETPASPEVAKAASGMSKKSAKDFAKTKHEGLPEKKEETKEEFSLVDMMIAQFSPLNEAPENTIPGGTRRKGLAKTIQSKEVDKAAESGDYERADKLQDSATIKVKKKSKSVTAPEEKSTSPTPTTKKPSAGKTTAYERATRTSAAGRIRAARIARQTEREKREYKEKIRQEKKSEQQSEAEDRRKSSEEKQQKLKEIEKGKRADSAERSAQREYDKKQSKKERLRKEIGAATQVKPLDAVSSKESDAKAVGPAVQAAGQIAAIPFKLAGVALKNANSRRKEKQREETGKEAREKSLKDDSKNESFFNWREEFIFEVDDQVVNPDQKKIIDVSKKKNNIEINPKIDEAAPLIPIIARLAGGMTSRAVGSKLAGTAAKGSLRSKAAEFAANKAGNFASNAVQDKLGPDDESRKDGDIKDKITSGAEGLLSFLMPKSKVNEAAAWTKKSGKNQSGGLNEKGRKSYEAENPGSDLKAPSKTVGNPRRKSFCARMSGMKSKLTSAKTARDPDSRINKSLRAWNC